MKKKIITILIIISLIFNIGHYASYLRRKNELLNYAHHSLKNISTVLHNIPIELEETNEEPTYSLDILSDECVHLTHILDEMCNGLSTFKRSMPIDFVMFEFTVENAVLAKDIESLKMYSNIINDLKDGLSDESGNVNYLLSLRTVLNKYSIANHSCLTVEANAKEHKLNNLLLIYQITISYSIQESHFK